MQFLNSPSTRIPLALVGGILYGLLTHYILLVLNISLQISLAGGIIVFFFYFGSRLLLLFSGIDTLYYSTGRSILEKNHFYRTAQWVGKLYYYHDLFLLIFLGLISLAFIFSLLLDVKGDKPFGQTLQEFLNLLPSLYEKY